MGRAQLALLAAYLVVADAVGRGGGPSGSAGGAAHGHSLGSSYESGATAVGGADSGYETEEGPDGGTVPEDVLAVVRDARAQHLGHRPLRREHSWQRASEGEASAADLATFRACNIGVSRFTVLVSQN